MVPGLFESEEPAMDSTQRIREQLSAAIAVAAHAERVAKRTKQAIEQRARIAHGSTP